MPKQFDDWAEQVVERMWFPPDRKRVRKELLDHMEDAQEALMEQGLTDEQAQEQAVTAMGDAKAVGKALNKVHRPILGWLWFASKWVCIFMVVVVVFQLWAGSYEGNLLLGIKDRWRWSCAESPCRYVDWGDIPVESGLTMKEGDYTFQLHHGTIGITETDQPGQYWNWLMVGIQASTDQWWQVFPKGLHNINAEMSNGKTFSARNRQADGEACLVNINYQDKGLPFWNVHVSVEYYTDAPVEWIRLYVPDTNIDFTVWMNGEVTR